jgi:hypothetical protein
LLGEAVSLVLLLVMDYSKEIYKMREQIRKKVKKSFGI